MSKPKSLTRRQRTVIEALFADNASEQQVLAEHGVSRDLYARWLADERFQEAFENRIAQAHRAGRLALARAASQAASALIALAQGKPGETTRKACLDILATQPNAPLNSAAGQTEAPEIPTSLNPETVSRLLAILAEPSSDADRPTR